MSDIPAGPRLLDVPRDWTLPRLGKRVVPPGGRVESETVEDTVTHYDTAAGDLAALDIALERGSGAEAVWTLTVDGTTSQYPAPTRAVPVELRDLLLGVRAGAAIRAAGRTRVERVSHHVLDEAGTELGCVTEVAVHDLGVTDLPASARTHVEVAGWDGPFVDAVVRRLVKADAVDRIRPREAEPADGSGSVGSALLAYLRVQRRAALRADLDLRRGEDTVHAFRVALRRIRSALRVVDVADPDRHTALDAELRWLSGILGATRDLEVLREHLTASLDELVGDTGDTGDSGTDTGTDVDLGPARRALEVALDRDDAAARATLTTTLRSRRYLALLKTLRSWVDDPPFLAAADEPRGRLSRYVRAAAKDLDKRLRKAGGSAPRLHAARKAAKRARYVAAFAGDAAGKHGHAIERRAKALQTNLGDHQDCVLAADYVRAAAAGLTGAAAFGCGVLWAHEQDRAETALAAARTAAG